MWNDDYKDMLSALCGAGVDFLLVGAYAMAAHGFPRATVDLDLWVAPEPANAQRLLEALAVFGAPLQGVAAADFEHDDTVFQIGVAPRRIDLLTGISGVSFAEAARAAISVEVDGLRVRVLSREHLIQNKLATGRPRDLDDARQLARLPQPSER